LNEIIRTSPLSRVSTDAIKDCDFILLQFNYWAALFHSDCPTLNTVTFT